MNIILAMSGLEKLSLGGNTMLLGLVMVFVVLGILIGMVELIRTVLNKANNKKATKQESAKVEVPAEPVVATASNDEEVVAAISAALAMYYEAKSADIGKSVKFRVRSIREIR